MAEVPAESYLLAEEQGEMYFCNARCLCLWAVHFVTNPRRSEEQKRIACELTTPTGERRRFADLIEAAQWSAANALQGESNPWLIMELPLRNGTRKVDETSESLIH
jgi:hypothetical protein